MRSRMFLGLLSLVLAAAAAPPGVSAAAITTIGSQTLTTGMENDMSLGTFVEFSSSGPAAEYVSPIDGTIVTWRIDSGSTNSPVKLRVLRPASGGKFTGAGTSALEMTTGAIDTFATSLPVKAGDVIGLDNESQALIFTKNVLGAFPEVFTPALADGAPAAEPKEVIGGGMGLTLQINADIQPTSGRPGPPILAGVKVVPKSVKKGKGGTIRYIDSQPGTTIFTTLQKQPGRRNKRGVCARPPRKPNGRPCTRMVKINTLTNSGAAGLNSFFATGLVDGLPLKPGSYELKAVARNAGGLTSKPVVTSFSVHR